MPPTSIRAEPIGLGCLWLLPSEEGILECLVSAITTVKQFVIPSRVAFRLLVTDITVAGTRVLHCGPIPAAMFTEESMIATFEFPTANEGQCISITLRNISKFEVEVSVFALVAASSR